MGNENLLKLREACVIRCEISLHFWLHVCGYNNRDNRRLLIMMEKPRSWAAPELGGFQITRCSVAAISHDAARRLRTTA